MEMMYSMGVDTITINPTRLEKFNIASLLKGSHLPPNGHFEACAMEWASYLANEPWSDSPQCVCPTIRAFMVGWNDGLTDDRRDILKPLIPLVLGTNGGPELSLKRSYMVADWMFRVYVPTWLELAKLNGQASALRGLEPVTDPSTLQATIKPMAAARATAGDAAVFGFGA